ncbi:hypothetical protein BJ166DRAFT_26079 [Pestalotiopsis sp. NC0098]|nr:hypothetical protein BJ166DRAFT_26079 [Pestalotiopsis sp. NC0098]
MAKQETTISVDISSLEFRAIRVSAQNLEAGGRQRPGPNNFLMIDAQPSRCPNSTLMIRFRVIIFSLFRFFSVYCFNFLVRFLLGLASRSLMALLSTAACKRRLVSLRCLVLILALACTCLSGVKPSVGRSIRCTHWPLIDLMSATRGPTCRLVALDAISTPLPRGNTPTSAFQRRYTSLMRFSSRSSSVRAPRVSFSCGSDGVFTLGYDG